MRLVRKVLMTAPKWSPEPWITPEGMCICGAYHGGASEDAMRATSCVNALAGVADPEQAIALAREALENADRWIGNAAHPSCEISVEAGIGCDCGSDEARDNLHAALAALGAE